MNSNESEKKNTATSVAAEKELQQRRQGIVDCISWVNAAGAKSNNNKSFQHVAANSNLFSFETSLAQEKDATTATSSLSSYRPPMVSVFATKPILRGQIILTIPQTCIVSETHPLLRDMHQKAVLKAMMVYQDNINNNNSSINQQYSPWDPFITRSHGIILSPDELRIALHVTLLLFAKRRRRTTTSTSTHSSASKKSALQKACQHWDSYLETLPRDYSSLVFHWSEEEIHNLKGTSCHALAQRLRKEVNENWEQSFRNVLLDYLRKEDAAAVGQNDEINANLLYQCYMDAICGCYSRCHGMSSSTSSTNKNAANANSRSLCPLLDLFNGNRDDSSEVNIHVVRYSGTHVALETSRDIAPGEELMIPYGDFSNQVFLTVFGFLPLQQQKHGNTTLFPQMVPLDAVYVLPPPHLVGSPEDPKWEAYASQGKPLQRQHMIEKPPYVTSEIGTPFALLGNRSDMQQVRTHNTTDDDDDYVLPSYLVNFHVFAITSLLKPKDLYIASDEMVDYIAEWHPGAFILEMIDYRLEQYSTKTMNTNMIWSTRLSDDQSVQSTQHGNMRTGTLYRMLEIDILRMWRHAIAKHYDVYGKLRNKKTGDVWKPLVATNINTETNSSSDGETTLPNVCATCQSALSDPLKVCTRCKQVSYCSRSCQVEDWKAGHKQACNLAKNV